MASVRFMAPAGLAKQPPSEDLIAEIQLEVGEETVGGITVRLAAEGALPANDLKVFDAILRVMEKRKIPVSLANRERMLINSGSVQVSSRELRDLIKEEMVKRVGNEGGRYLVSFQLRSIAGEVTQVKVDLLIVAPTLSAGILGGQPAESNGRLEQELLRAVAAELQSQQ